MLRGLFLWPFLGIAAAAGLKVAQISNPGRIGHMCAEMDAFLKERELGLIPYVKPVLLLQRKKAGNLALLDLFKSYVTVWDKRWQKLLFGWMLKFSSTHYPLGRPVVGFGEAARYYQINHLWGDRPPVIRLPDEIQAKGRDRLAELGVPEDAWFVCVHAREGGYSPKDENIHAHRNSDIATYHLAIKAITDRGGWIVRVGDATMTPMPPMDQAVDYALSDRKSDWMDLWLCANNRFLLGTSSGLIMAATMFHKPCVLVNMVPHGSSYGPGPNDLAISKLLIDADGQPMRFPDIFAQRLSDQRYAESFDQRGVRFQNNSAEDILGVMEEMLARLDGTFETTAEDEDLQRRYRALLTPHDYSFGATSMIGRDWLRAHRHLLVD
ncbi:MAG: TIGR04372 family glycosyltransferase [Pseudomonadota bacterium]